MTVRDAEIAPASVLADLDTLAAISLSGPGVSRVAYSHWDTEGRRWFTARATALEMECEIDRFGNAVAWSRGARLQPALLLGSHLDTVRNGGRYDGALGVAVGLAVAGHVLAEDPTAAVGVVGFACEESTRFGIGAVGSALLVGALGCEALNRLRDADGQTLGDLLIASGLDANGPITFTRHRVRAFLEVHIDQGSALADGDAVGIVTTIAGTARIQIVFVGEAAHSGAHVRERRRNALLGAARLIVEADDLWAAADPSGTLSSVTVGRIDVAPNAANAVAGRSEVVVDLRAADSGLLGELQESMVRSAQAIAVSHRLGLEITELGRIAPVAMDRGVVGHLAAAARRTGIEHRLLPSMAGHDAEVIAHHVPTGMLFVANPAAVSHNPDEAISEASLTGALRIIEHAVSPLGAGVEPEVLNP